MEYYEHLQSYLGLRAEPKDLTFLQVSLRGIIVFLVSLVMVRLGDRRFLPKKTAFDAILVFVLASMLARAINGSAAFFPTLGGGFVLVGLHRLLAMIAFHSHCVGELVKGVDDLVVKDGKLIEEKMRRNHLTERDLLEELRINGNVSDPKNVKEARMERSGEVSVVPFDEKSGAS